MLHCIDIGNSYSLFNHANQKLSVYTSWNFNLIELKIDMGQDLGVAKVCYGQLDMTCNTCWFVS